MTSVIVILTAAALVLTKWFDCISTSRQISHIGQEQNRLARYLMMKIGIRKAIWIVFFIHLLITVLSLLILYLYEDQMNCKWLFILTGIFISVVQAAVAESNHRGRLNGISWMVLKWMRR